MIKMLAIQTKSVSLSVPVQREMRRRMLLHSRICTYANTSWFDLRMFFLLFTMRLSLPNKIVPPHLPPYNPESRKLKAKKPISRHIINIKHVSSYTIYLDYLVISLKKKNHSEMQRKMKKIISQLK